MAHLVRDSVTKRDKSQPVTGTNCRAAKRDNVTPPPMGVSRHVTPARRAFDDLGGRGDIESLGRPNGGPVSISNVIANTVSRTRAREALLPRGGAPKLRRLGNGHRPQSKLLPSTIQNMGVRARRSGPSQQPLEGIEK